MKHYLAFSAVLILILLTKEDQLLFAPLYVTQILICGLVLRIFSLKAAICTFLLTIFITGAYTLFLLDLRKNQEVDYSKAVPATKIEMNDWRKLALTGYMPLELPSWFLGNLTGLVGFWWRFASEHMYQNWWHHAYASAFLSLNTVLFWIYGNKKLPNEKKDI